VFYLLSVKRALKENNERIKKQFDIFFITVMIFIFFAFIWKYIFYKMKVSALLAIIGGTSGYISLYWMLFNSISIKM